MQGQCKLCSLCHSCSSSRGPQPSTLIPDFCSRTVWHMRPTRSFTFGCQSMSGTHTSWAICDCALFDLFPLLQQSSRRTSDARSRGACDDKPLTCMALDCGCKSSQQKSVMTLLNLAHSLLTAQSSIELSQPRWCLRTPRSSCWAPCHHASQLNLAPPSSFAFHCLHKQQCSILLIMCLASQPSLLSKALCCFLGQ